MCMNSIIPNSKGTVKYPLQHILVIYFIATYIAFDIKYVF